MLTTVLTVIGALAAGGLLAFAALLYSFVVIDDLQREDLERLGMEDGAA